MHSTVAICMHLEFTLREFSCVSAQSEKFYKCQKHLCFSKEVYAGYTTVRQSQKLSWGLDEFEGLSKRSNFVGKHPAVAFSVGCRSPFQKFYRGVELMIVMCVPSLADGSSV